MYGQNQPFTLSNHLAPRPIVTQCNNASRTTQDATTLGRATSQKIPKETSVLRHLVISHTSKNNGSEVSHAVIQNTLWTTMCGSQVASDTSDKPNSTRI